MANTRSNLVAAQIYEVEGPPNARERKGGGVEVVCMFNPFEYSISKSNTYQEKNQNNADVPQFEFTKAGAQTLKLNLTFDTYEQGEDVSRATNQLWKLMESKTRQEGSRTRKVPPPEVAFEWGVFRFVAVITSMTQKFTLFLPDGTPVRAQVDVTFTQNVDEQDYPSQNPTSGGGPIHSLRRILAGDRLDTIAFEVYGDSTRWRRIADHNGIRNPLALRPGQILKIPEE